MKPASSEPAECTPDWEIRVGVASWDDGSRTARSAKFTWFDENGKAAGGGEIPIEALPPFLDFAILKEFLTSSCK
ncbi:MAG: hypothetical protein ACYDCO_07865 [Armatimonadota bacterium]